MRFPLAITAYNRPEMLARVLHALSAALCWCNSWEHVEKLYIFSDGPRSEANIPLVNKVRDLAYAFDWLETEIVEHAHNIGQKHAIPYAMDYVLSRHETVVHLEDDVVPGLFFLPFMARALETYATDRRVFGVCGYTRTLPAEVVAQWPYDAHFYPRVGTAAWGTWRRPWETHTCRDLPEMARLAQETGIDFSIGGNDLPRTLAKYLESETANWSLAWGLRMAMARGLYLYPMRSLVENIGHGTGVSHSKHHGPPLVMADHSLEHLPPAYDLLDESPPLLRSTHSWPAELDAARAIFKVMKALYP